jgi:hypothetical protein
MEHGAWSITADSWQKAEVRRSEVRGEADLRSPTCDLCDRRLERFEPLEGFDESTGFALGSAAR